MTDEIFIRLKRFVVQKACVYEKEVVEGASLEDDLGVHGDDAVEFIIGFGKEFKVDVSRFMAADYFTGEGFDEIGPIVRLISGKKKKERKDLKVSHLLKAVLAGKLDEEVING